MSVTIKDIAKKAGVAHTTVSRALRGSPLISAEATERIQQIAEELGYHPSAAARSLKTRRSRVLGVIVSHIADPFFSEILQGIEDVAQPCGYSLFIAAAQHDSAREQAIVRTMREHRVDGVILCSTPFSIEQSRQLHAQDTPIVVINNQSAEEHCYSIYHDDLDGSRKVTRHLIELGHERIAYLGNSLSGRTNVERLTGYRQEMQSAGLTVPDGYMMSVDGGAPEQGLVGVNHFLSLPKRPTAIFCYNDLLAVGVLKGLLRAGIRIPEDCSVVGFDNIVISAFTHPSLTTFDQPKRHIGAEAARLLFNLLDRDPNSELAQEQKAQALQGNLLVRDSTAPPPVIS
jgi:DNA-binding LacI/PurR family transcriptional regulator